MIEEIKTGEYFKNLPSKTNKNKKVSERDIFFVGEKGYKILEESFKKLMRKGKSQKKI